MWHIIIEPAVSKALGKMLPSRESKLAVLNRIYDQLGNHADRYRDRRDAEEPDSLFDYIVTHLDGVHWHKLRFSVDDRTAVGYLFVVAVTHETWPA